MNIFGTIRRLLSSSGRFSERHKTKLSTNLPGGELEVASIGIVKFSVGFTSFGGASRATEISGFRFHACS